MKTINERGFEICQAPTIWHHLRITYHAERYLAAIKGDFQNRDAPDRLPPRLRRDARVDELDIERRRIAKAPLIR